MTASGKVTIKIRQGQRTVTKEVRLSGQRGRLGFRATRAGTASVSCAAHGDVVAARASAKVRVVRRR